MLTETQRRWLSTATSEGWLGYYDHGVPRRRKVRLPTIWACAKRGLVEAAINHRPPVDWYAYTLTDAGRRALESKQLARRLTRSAIHSFLNR